MGKDKEIRVRMISGYHRNSTQLSSPLLSFGRSGAIPAKASYHVGGSGVGTC
jgi:hypothetical protein